MDKVRQAFGRMKWSFAPDDPSALAQLERRIERSGKRGKTLTYSELADGVEFDLPGFSNRPYHIDIHNWTELDRKLIGDFLGYISMRSYQRSGVFASALVVNKDDHLPGPGFYGLLADLGVISSKDDVRGPIVWGEHVEKAKAAFSGRS